MSEVIDQWMGEGWALYNGDSAVVLPGIPDNSVDLSIMSPPFGSLYTYSDTERDLGNCRDEEEFFEHFGFITEQLLRVTRPGRLACIHVQQLVRSKANYGVISMHDFRGDVIRHFQSKSWVYHGEAAIDKNPQSQAIRTKSKQLLFVQLRKDASWMRPALADYVLLFRKPGENAVPVKPDITNEDWILWAHPVWYDVRETHTLNVAIARDDADERHLCPLQLDTIERCVRLWSNPGETVLDPFNGVGSTGVVALQHGRRYLGVELNPRYASVAARNLAAAEREAHAPTLLDLMGAAD